MSGEEKSDLAGVYTRLGAVESSLHELKETGNERWDQLQEWMTHQGREHQRIEIALVSGAGQDSMRDRRLEQLESAQRGVLKWVAGGVITVLATIAGWMLTKF